MSPKTLTGLELELDDAPAREAELFLVDGNNLAYRAYFALPEELATTEGFPTNALLGFTNMLFKLLSDYRPKGVAVAWDTSPVHRKELSPEYKVERRPMPDLLREQFPHFRPIVEAFGYRNLEFEGWEADDVIATLATRADAAAINGSMISHARSISSDVICARISSTPPNSLISSAANLGPIPVTPGMLSLVSPLSPMKSGTWSGRTP